MTRKGAGTILLVGFVLVIVILTIAAYMAPPQVRVERSVHEDFVDTLSYMTTVVDAASRLPGTVSEKENFIDSSFASLSEYLSQKGISLTYTNFTLALEGGGENVVIFYTLARGDSYFVGLLATNLTDLEKGIGLGSGGGFSPPGGESLEECIPIRTFPSFLVLYSGFPGGGDREGSDDGPQGRGFAYGLRMIRLFLFNLQPEDYNLTMDLEVDTYFDIKRGMYINFQPIYINRFNSFEGEEFYISARESGITGLAFLHVRPTFIQEGEGYLNISPEDTPETDCVGTYTIKVYITDDWDEYRELQFQAIRDGIRNLLEWIREGSGSDW